MYYDLIDKWYLIKRMVETYDELTVNNLKNDISIVDTHIDIFYE